MNLQELADKFLKSGNTLESIREEVLDLSTQEFFKLMSIIDKQQEKARAQKYQYMVTFTTDPEKHPEEPIAKIEEYIESQGQRPALQVESGSYVAEKHKSGRTHWHMKLITTKALRSDAFNQFQKAYGKVDISRSKHTDGSHIDIYMNKEGTIKDLKVT